MERDRAYSTQIDGLRAFAVLAVLYTHLWFPFSYFGHWGVQLFFVISGYLITGILLEARAKRDAGAESRILISFYARRVLRIFPAFYLALGIAAAVGIDGVRETLLWHMAFASNILFVTVGDWEPWPTAHLWSLAVEEQFYLVWAPLMLALPRRWIIPTMIALAFLAPVFRAVIVLIDTPPVVVYAFMPASLDAFCGGALLAACSRLVRGGVPVWTLRWLGIAGAAAVGLIFLFPDRPAAIDEIALESAAVLPMVAMVGGAIRGFGGVVGYVLNFSWLRYIGKISYGIYIWHMLIVAYLAKHSPFGHVMDWSTGPVLMVVGTVLCVSFATISWYGFELPINRLKRYFPYTRPGRASLAAATLPV
jgi:peptidoglycan/LPS O-acetylase OafA/YrhL